jgi:hypothetical protein
VWAVTNPIWPPSTSPQLSIGGQLATRRQSVSWYVIKVAAAPNCSNSSGALPAAKVYKMRCWLVGWRTQCLYQLASWIGNTCMRVWIKLYTRKKAIILRAYPYGRISNLIGGGKLCDSNELLVLLWRAFFATSQNEDWCPQLLRPVRISRDEVKHHGIFLWFSKHGFCCDHMENWGCTQNKNISSGLPYIYCCC